MKRRKSYSSVKIVTFACHLGELPHPTTHHSQFWQSKAGRRFLRKTMHIIVQLVKCPENIDIITVNINFEEIKILFKFSIILLGSYISAGHQINQSLGDRTTAGGRHCHVQCLGSKLYIYICTYKQ